MSDERKLSEKIAGFTGEEILVLGNKQPTIKEYLELKASLIDAVETLHYYQETHYCYGCGNDVTKSYRADDTIAKLKFKHKFLGEK